MMETNLAVIQKQHYTQNEYWKMSSLYQMCMWNKGLKIKKKIVSSSIETDFFYVNT